MTTVFAWAVHQRIAAAAFGVDGLLAWVDDVSDLLAAANAGVLAVARTCAVHGAR